MNEIDSIIKIMPNQEAAQISNSYHVDYIRMLNSNLSLVKFRGKDSIPSGLLFLSLHHLFKGGRKKGFSKKIKVKYINEIRV